VFGLGTDGNLMFALGSEEVLNEELKSPFGMEEYLTSRQEREE
jgi:hypothetical protein